MVKFLRSSAPGRISALQRSLTLDLVTRHGLFGAAIIEMRSRWGITDCCCGDLYQNGVDDGVVIFTPEEWPKSIPSSPFPSTDIDERADLLLAPPEVSNGGPYLVAWYRDLKRMHDQFVPESCRSRDLFPETSWVTFLSRCVLCNPVRPRLLEFANRAVVRIDVPMSDPAHGAEDRCIQLEKYAMIHAPIETVTDARHIEHAWISFYEELFSLIGDALKSQHGIDLKALREDVADKHPDIWSRQRERLSSAGKRLLIHVDEETSENDVVGAYKIIKAGLPGQPRQGRPKRDPLVCVQCAIWYDEEGWSHVQIAERFGWAIQYPAGQKPRSETARLHIAEGRRILKQRQRRAAI